MVGEKNRISLEKALNSSSYWEISLYVQEISPVKQKKDQTGSYFYLNAIDQEGTRCQVFFFNAACQKYENYFTKNKTFLFKKTKIKMYNAVFQLVYSSNIGLSISQQQENQENICDSLRLYVENPRPYPVPNSILTIKSISSEEILKFKGKFLPPESIPGSSEKISRFFYTPRSEERKSWRVQSRCTQCNQVISSNLDFKVELILDDGSRFFKVVAFQAVSEILNKTEEYFFKTPQPADLLLQELQKASDYSYYFEIKQYYKGLALIKARKLYFQ